MSLELDRDLRHRRRDVAMADPNLHYPKPPKNRGWLKALLGWVVKGIVVLAILGAGWRLWQGDGWSAPLRRGADRVLGAMGDEGAQRRGTGNNEGIDCATGEPGEFLVYTDDKGTENVVESAAQVPSRFHDRVRCVHLGQGSGRRERGDDEVVVEP